jgi:hypothetical protein
MVLVELLHSGEAEVFWVPCVVAGEVTSRPWLVVPVADIRPVDEVNEDELEEPSLLDSDPEVQTMLVVMVTLTVAVTVLSQEVSSVRFKLSLLRALKSPSGEPLPSAVSDSPVSGSDTGRTQAVSHLGAEEAKAKLDRRKIQKMVKAMFMMKQRRRSVYMERKETSLDPWERSAASSF